MVRVILYVVLLAVLAFGATWLVDRPGAITIVWLGQEVRTSVVVALCVLAAFVVLVMLVWSLLRTVLRTPGSLSLFFRTRRRAHGFQAITRGMIAVGSGDARAAQRHAGEAERILGREPLALLLKAQAAQLAGSREGAEQAFSAMLETDETRALGLRGLFIEARRRGDRPAAKLYAGEAARVAPGLPWAGTAVFEAQVYESDWDGALSTLGRSVDARLVDKETGKRHRAVLLTAKALDLLGKDLHADPTPEAKGLTLEAVKLAPGLVPAAVIAGRALAREGDYKKASRVLEQAFKLSPHPDIAEAYADIRPGDSAHDRLKRMQALARQKVDHPESLVAVARAAIAAREFPLARSSLRTLFGEAATERAYLLMADLEEAEHGDRGRVRQWLTRAVTAPRDPAWTADGIVAKAWAPISPVTGRLDAFEWKQPVADLAPPSAEASDAVLADVDEPPAPAPIVEAVPEPAPVVPAPPLVAEPVAEEGVPAGSVPAGDANRGNSKLAPDLPAKDKPTGETAELAGAGSGRSPTPG